MGCALFDTAIGRCGIAWSDTGITRLQLPEVDDAATLARLGAGAPGAAPAWVEELAARLRRHLAGEPQDLASVPLDLAGVPLFARRVYDAARAVPSGATVTYGELAARLGSKGASRAVGQALGRNPFAVIVPCHRVVAGGGRMGGFSAHGGAALKDRLLRIEGGAVEGRRTAC